MKDTPQLGIKRTMFDLNISVQNTKIVIRGSKLGGDVVDSDEC